MSLGLMRKRALCKICCSFDDETLSQITVDILLNRRSYREIRSFYSVKLPEGVRPLNDVNINNHRKHSDPALLAREVLQGTNGATSDADIISQLYGEIFQKEIDKKKILTEVYRERLKNVKVLQAILDERKREFEALRGVTDDLRAIGTRRDLQREIRNLTKEVDEIQSSIQQVVLRELTSEKGVPEAAIYIQQNFISNVQGHLKGFLDEFVPYLLLDVFAGDTALGKEVVRRLSQAMDKHLMPALNETKLVSSPSHE